MTDLEQLRAENARPLPCPFCGATPHSMKSKKMYDQDGEPYQDRIIRCPHLCASMQGGEEAIADRWNTRAALFADPAPVVGVTVPVGAVEAIANYQQGDMDGTFVLVSRQAIEECLPALRAIAGENGNENG